MTIRTIWKSTTYRNKVFLRSKNFHFSTFFSRFVAELSHADSLCSYNFPAKISIFSNPHEIPTLSRPRWRPRWDLFSIDGCIYTSFSCTVTCSELLWLMKTPNGLFYMLLLLDFIINVVRR